MARRWRWIRRKTAAPHLADWLVSRDNPYFARAIVNRIWENFFGVGMVENVDDLRVTNPASNEKLLSAAAKYLADQKFDLKALMRAILQSETYQRTSVPLPENAADTRFYSRYYPRRMMAEVMLDTISEVTDTYGSTTSPASRPNCGQEVHSQRLARDAVARLRVDSYFLKSFGRPEREKTCECERTAEPNVSQVLHIANGDTINKKLEAKDNDIGKLLGSKTPPDKMNGTRVLEFAFSLSDRTRKEKTHFRSSETRNRNSCGRLSRTCIGRC